MENPLVLALLSAAGCAASPMVLEDEVHSVMGYRAVAHRSIERVVSRARLASIRSEWQHKRITLGRDT